MKKLYPLSQLLLFFTLSYHCAYAFYDGELESLWNSISDIDHPTLEDYRLVENYLSTGRRQNLDLFRSQLETGNPKFCRLFNFKLIGDNNEPPVFESHYLHVNQNNQERCILLYGSYNGIYPDKVRKILSELKRSGYRGHVLLRIGGFPNVAHGGLKICHVPYAFKVAFFREAQLLGYKNILWIDSALHPLTSLEHIFKEIKESGFFFTTVGSLQDNSPSHHPDAARSLEIDIQCYNQIPHLSSAIIGLNMENSKAMQLLDHWYKETERVYPTMTWFPEELSLSVIGWRLQCQPYSWFGNLVCHEHELLQLIHQRPLEFFLDCLR